MYGINKIMSNNIVDTTQLLKNESKYLTQKSEKLCCRYLHVYVFIMSSILIICILYNIAQYYYVMCHSYLLK